MMGELLELKRRLVDVAAVCYRRGLQAGDGGNLSARVPGQDLMVIKGSGTSFADCSVQKLMLSDFAGNPAEGGDTPSKESLLHGALYGRLTWLQAIVHCHSPWATSWASTMQPLPFVTYHSAMKLRGEVKVFDTDSYAVPPSFFPQILALFDSSPELAAFLLKGHGQVALGRHIKEALQMAELVEETAQIAIIGRLLAKA